MKTFPMSHGGDSGSAPAECRAPYRILWDFAEITHRGFRIACVCP